LGENTDLQPSVFNFEQSDLNSGQFCHAWIARSFRMSFIPQPVYTAIVWHGNCILLLNGHFGVPAAGRAAH
jgi:hypothetical protein